MSELFYSRDEECKILFNDVPFSFTDEDSIFKQIEVSLCYGESGLKTFRSVERDDILRVAEQIHSHQDGVPPESKLELLLQVASKKNLIHCIEKYRLIPTIDQRPKNYPSNLTWKSNGKLQKVSEVIPDKYSFVAGGVCYISKQRFSQYVRDSEPKNNDLLDQLLMLVKDVSRPDDKFGEIYTLLARRGATLDKILKELNKYKWVLTENGFKYLTEVSFSRKDSEQFSPYIFQPISCILKEEKFYSKLGVKSLLKNEDLLNLCKVIEKDVGGKKQGDCDWVTKSKSFTNCLDHMSKEFLDENRSKLCLPVLANGVITFHPSNECYYDDIFKTEQKKELENLDDCKIVYLKSMTNILAQKLCLKPLTEKLLDIEEFGDDDMEQFGQVVDVTTRIKEALREYSEGSIFKEMIQNAEDANATSTTFYMDDRDFSDNCTSLFGDNMKDCQGPSIMIHNDAKFSDEDFNNLIKIGGATKKENSEKIGSFGIGFNSVYHYTNAPEIVSGDYFVQFDPSMKHLPKKLLRNPSKPGIKINIKKGPQKLDSYKDQFLPFKIKELDLDLNYNKNGIHYDGTVTRLPLRIKGNKDLSQLCFSTKDFSKMHNFFDEEKFSFLPFLSTVKSIQYMTNNGEKRSKKNILKVVKDEKILQSNTSLDVPFKRHVTNFIKKENGNSAPFISSIVSQKSYQDGKLQDDESLLLVKRTAEKNSNAFELADLPEGKEHGLQPMVGIAIPLKLTGKSRYMVKREDNSFGQLYSHLPLNLESKSNFHIHAGFALSSNRKQLHVDDNLSNNSIRSRWNQTLLLEEVPQAFLTGLEELKSLQNNSEVMFIVWF